ncbi:imidazole glycerol phosphate synthase subunit HisF [SAR202 cluster bacterium AD-812-D07_MRT_10900m]|nr:imidazole glycerol phosphate synthase subunit HisF [SAR202 cluster bacterium AD-812-D07_MRT_10900m]
MLKTRLIPSLLLRDGRCVKGTQFGNYRDVGHPVTAAKVYEAQGADELLFLDITASADNRATLYDAVSATAEQCFMPLTVGGGVRTIEDIRKLLSVGADKVTVNSAAIKNPALITDGSREFGNQCVILSIDHRIGMSGKQEVFSRNGTESTNMTPVEWAVRGQELGAGEILLTSIEREGNQQGYDLETIAAVADSVDIPVIAAGGAGTLADLVSAVETGHASAVAAASIFHFTDQSVIKAHSYMKQMGLDVRMA